ncbi:hypothetical protein F2Q70_00031965 [Brassica cretica]|uniref:F-box domain-containing protein n=1 Tax=Brassica cretica TaxID=69181 RepID=A0A8S9FDX9_BRACR|nr:hypothetical protein F2Q70_00031965 [Brassica cretica]
MKKINKKKKQKEREESLLSYFLGFVFPCKFLDFSSLTCDLVFFREGMSKAYVVAKGMDYYQEMLALGQDHTGRVRASSSRSRPRKVRIREYKIPDLNEDPCLDMDEEETGEVVGFRPQDADYSQNVPQLPYELEVEILARLPRFEYWKLKFLNKRFSRLLKEGKIFKVRRDRGVVEPSVFMRSHGDTKWTMFDKDFENYQEVPELPLPSDSSFFLGDKESLCAGTHLIVTGNEGESIALWRWSQVESYVEGDRRLFSVAFLGG